MPDRSSDWFKQSLRDFEQAVDCRNALRHEWACFAAHQAAEKAVKALHLATGQEAWGHMISRLLSELPSSIKVPEELVDKGKVLDSFYISPRYPDSFPEGAPFEHFGSIQSEEALRYAGEIIEFVREKMAFG